MRPEETQTRLAYARYSYAVELGTIYQEFNAHPGSRAGLTLDTLHSALRKGGVTFEVTNFKVQSLQDIGAQGTSSLVLRAIDEYPIIRSVTVAATAAEGPERLLSDTEATARWGVHPRALLPQMKPYTLSDAIAKGQYLWVRNVATYRVTASLASISKTYSAFAMFGSSADGEMIVEIKDPIAEDADRFVKREDSTFTLYPVFLLLSVGFDSQAGREYLKEKEITVPTSGGACDEITFTCGVLASDVEKRLNSPLITPDSPSLRPTVKPLERSPHVPTGGMASAPLDVPAGTQQSCSNYNFAKAGTAPWQKDYHEHVSGFHGLSSSFTGTCTYSALPGTNQCNATAQATPISLTPYEGGQLSNLIYIHGYGITQIAGTAVNGQAAAGAGIAVEDCLVSCAVTVSLSGGLTLSAPPSALWSITEPFYMACLPQATTCNFAPGGPPYIPPGIGYYIWNTSSCSWTVVYCTSSCSSPIIIDTDGSGFKLTSAAKGIYWDFYGNGHPIQIAWTAAGSTNGWLVLDRNGNGVIDSAQELFGNVSPQPATPSSTNLNGFLSLAVFDNNGDGIIDAKDSIWPKLQVWIDSNHDGISQSSELHPVDSLGIHSISLDYEKDSKTDTYGNRFRYRGSLNTGSGDKVNRVIYDVFLTAE